MSNFRMSRRGGSYLIAQLMLAVLGDGTHRRCTSAAAFIRPLSSSRTPQTFYSSFVEPPDETTFGRREYWNDFYTNEEEFSWYSRWEDLEPFVRELIPGEALHILIPGIGNDGAIVEMYDAGYHNLTAFDYAQAGVDCSRKLLGEDRIRGDDLNAPGVTLLMADARQLPFDDCSFDGVFEKGTLDAIYLSGGRDKELSAKHLKMAVAELARVLTEDGIAISITAACTDAVQMAFASMDDWEQLRDGTPYITEDGFASTNVDGTLLAWKLIRKEI